MHKNSVMIFILNVFNVQQKELELIPDWVFYCFVSVLSSTISLSQMGAIV